MPSVRLALAHFRSTYTAMLGAAEVLRVTLEAEAGELWKVPVEICTIQAIVATRYQMHPAALAAKDRSEPLVTARHVAMFLARKLTKFPLQGIGESFGGFDHGAVTHACARIVNLSEQDANLRNTVAALEAACAGALARMPSQGKAAHV